MPVEARVASSVKQEVQIRTLPFLYALMAFLYFGLDMPMSLAVIIHRIRRFVGAFRIRPRCSPPRRK